MRKLKLLLGLGLIALSGAIQARADLTPDVSYLIGIGSYEIVGANAVTIDGQGEGNFYLGEITLTAHQPSSFQSPWSSVCTDVGGVVYLGSSYNYHEAQFDGNLTGLNPLWGSMSGNSALAQSIRSQAIQNAADIYNDYRGSSSYVYNSQTYTRAQWWAAIQLAVWDVLYDTGASGSDSTGLSGGRFSANSSAVTAAVYGLANQWILTAPSDRVYSGDILIPVKNVGGTWVADSGVQEMLYTITPVPEPTTMIAGALLLLPFGASTLRFLRKR